MKFEVGDMIVCSRDYGIVLKVEEFRVSVNWFDKFNDYGEGASTQVYRISNLIDAIDGEHNKLVKGNQ